MRVVVLGGTGEMGSRVARRLEGRGHDVVRAARSTGVDVQDAASLRRAFAGADCVVDCLNLQTMSRRRAVAFFRGAALAVTSAAHDAGVAHVVVVSIVGVTDPAVARSTGYYGGKAAQEASYARADVPVTVVRTTAWFTLAETFLHQIRLGPVAVVPRMRLRPVHPDAAADLVAEVVEGGPTSAPAAADGPALRGLAGVEETDAATMAAAVAGGSGVRVFAVPAPMAALRTGLLPGPDVPTDPRSFSDWVRTPDR